MLYHMKRCGGVDTEASTYISASSGVEEEPSQPLNLHVVLDGAVVRTTRLMENALHKYRHRFQTAPGLVGELFCALGAGNCWHHPSSGLDYRSSEGAAHRLCCSLFSGDDWIRAVAPEGHITDTISCLMLSEGWMVRRRVGAGI